MIRIAIVDDSKEYIDIIKRKMATIMEEIGYCQYDISEFTDGSMFVRDNSAYDVLLLDIDMPQMNGFEVTDRIDERLSVQGTTLIYISSHDNYVFESIKHSPFRFVRKLTELPTKFSSATIMNISVLMYLQAMWKLSLLNIQIMNCLISDIPLTKYII